MSTSRMVTVNGIDVFIRESGAGPLVLLCHGWPELSYSWRHQLPALAEAGFHAVAPDMRGYGRTDRPDAIDQYTLFHLIGDMVGLLDALGVEQAVIAGHDWGAPVAWHAALLRPDRFRGVIGLSVPFRPRGQVFTDRVPPETEDEIFYQTYFQTPGIAEAEFELDVRLTVRSILYGISGDAPPDPDGTSAHVNMVRRTGGMVPQGIRAESIPLPRWLSDRDLNVYVEEFSRTGFRG